MTSIIDSIDFKLYIIDVIVYINVENINDDIVDSIDVKVCINDIRLINSVMAYICDIITLQYILLINVDISYIIIT